MDSSPRVSSTPEGVVGSYPWWSPSLDDTLWASAREADSDERLSTLQPVSVDPRLLETRPNAKWIAARDSSAKQFSFAYSVDLPFVQGETWFQIAAAGTYDLIINGRPAAVWTVPAQAQLVGPEAPVLVSPQMILTNGELPVVVSPNSGLPGADTPAMALRVAHTRRPRAPVPAMISPRNVILPLAQPEPGAAIAISALIYAFLPMPIGWARDAFYPSQQSFFSLLTFWLFFEAIRGEALNRRYVTPAASSFVLTYFSWEGPRSCCPLFSLRFWRCGGAGSTGWWTGIYGDASSWFAPLS